MKHILPIAFFCLSLVACSSEPNKGDWYEEIQTGKRWKVNDIHYGHEILSVYGEGKTREQWQLEHQILETAQTTLDIYRATVDTIHRKYLFTDNFKDRERELLQLQSNFIKDFPEYTDKIQYWNWIPYEGAKKSIQEIKLKILERLLEFDVTKLFIVNYETAKDSLFRYVLLMGDGVKLEPLLLFKKDFRKID